MAAKMNREEILAAAAQIHFEEAWEIREQSEALSKRKAANRSELQNAAAMGHLSDEQIVELEELYPNRERASAAERLAKLEAQVEKAREQAEKEAARVSEPVTEDEPEPVAA